METVSEVASYPPRWYCSIVFPFSPNRTSALRLVCHGFPKTLVTLKAYSELTPRLPTISTNSSPFPFFLLPPPNFYSPFLDYPFPPSNPLSSPHPPSSSAHFSSLFLSLCLSPFIPFLPSVLSSPSPPPSCPHSPPLCHNY